MDSPYGFILRREWNVGKVDANLLRMFFILPFFQYSMLSDLQGIAEVLKAKQAERDRIVEFTYMEGIKAMKNPDSPILLKEYSTRSTKS
jgi:hypothetical protein